MSNNSVIRQRLAYYPPHLGWLETHAQQRAYHWHKITGNKVINFIGSTHQTLNNKKNTIIHKWKTIWYETPSDINIIMPDWEVIPNFPLPKFRRLDFWDRVSYIYKTYKPKTIITRTRFFPSSIIWWVYAKKKWIKWVHIEHGSSYVSLNSKVSSNIAWLYDQIIGRYIFRKANILIPISKACQKFIKKFTNRKTDVIYRWIEISNLLNADVVNLKKKYPNKIIMWYVGRLYKWKNIESLIGAYNQLDMSIKNKIQVVIVGDGEDLERLKRISADFNISFFGWKPFNEALAIQQQFDVHLHVSSPGGGISSSLLQAMALWCNIIATPYEWANEIITNHNGIILWSDDVGEIKDWIEKYLTLTESKKEKHKKINQKIIKTLFYRNKTIKQYEKIIT